MSRILDTSHARQHQTRRPETSSTDYSVASTNSDALAEMATSDTALDSDSAFGSDSFLDGLFPEQDELTDLEARASAPTDFVTNPKHTLEHRSTHAEDGTSDKLTATTDLKSVSGGYTMGQTDGARTQTRSVGGKLDRDRASLSLGGSDTTKTEAGTENGSAWSVGADTDGNVSGNYTLKQGQRSTSAGGAIDLAEDGSIEHVDAKVGTKWANGTSVAASVSIDPKAIQTDGRTVSWSQGASAGGKVGRGAGSVSGKLGAAEQQTRTFATAEEAQAFAMTLQHTRHDNRELDFAAMEPDTAVSFFIETTASGQAGAGIASAEVGNTHAQRFDVSCNAAGMLEVEIDNQAAANGVLGARTGMMAVGAGGSRESSVNTRMEIDPTSPAALEALQALIDGGQLDPSVQIPGLKFGVETDDRTCLEGRMDLAVAKLSEKACQGKGVYRDFDTGEHGTVDTAHTSESESGVLDSVSAFFGYDRSEQQGASSSDATVYDPEFIDGREGTHMRFKQVFDYQQREVSRRLHDQVTPGIDRHGISEQQLPSPDAAGMDEKQKWMLETVIDAEGTQAVFDGLESGDQSFEWDAQRLLHSVREDLVSGASTPAEAVAAFSQAGEDAYEGMRDLAGDEHTERYLMQEGSNVWIGRKANKDMSNAIKGLEARSLKGDPDARSALLGIMSLEEQRESLLGQAFADSLSGKGDGLPIELITEEMDRAMQNSITIQNSLHGATR